LARYKPVIPPVQVQVVNHIGALHSVTSMI
jgi:hypothetical protein